MSLSIIFLYSDRGHLLTVMNLWMKNLDFIISTKINYPIPALYFTLGLGVILFFKNCLFLFLEPGPPARSFVTRSLLIQLFPSCSVLCVLDRERFRERFQGTGWNGFRGEGLSGGEVGWREVTRPLANPTKLTEFTIIQRTFPHHSFQPITVCSTFVL